MVDDSDQADVVLLTGCRDDIANIDYYSEMLAPAAARKTPLICTSPDKIVLTQGGSQIRSRRDCAALRIAWCTSALDRHAEIYQHALDFLDSSAASNIVCIGDSLEHNIAGGRGAGLNTALVRTGILADLDAAGLEQNYQRYAVRPDYLLSHFKW